MAPSVWVQGKQLQEATGAPEPPSVWAPVGLDPQADAIRAALPDKPPGLPSVWAPSNPQPTVTLAKMPPDPGQQQITHDQQQLVKMQTEDKTPWGSPTNHPGKLGKTAHVFATLGNIAGDIFAPNVMARVPGTQAYRAGEENYLSDQLAKELTDEQQRQFSAANTAKTQEETAEMPGKTQSEEALQSAQTQNLTSEAAARGTDLASAYAHRVNSIIAQGGDPSQDRVTQHLADAITSIQKQPLPKGGEHVDLVGPDNKPMAATYDPEKKQYLDSKGNVIENPRPYEKPDQAGMVTVVAPDPNNPGGGVVERVGAGAHLAPGSMTASQYGSGAAADVKQGKAEHQAATVAAKDYQLMQTLATHPSPTNDLAMVMHYIGATKPDSLGKLRLNQNEISLVMGTRSTFGDLQALAQKVQSGQMLTPDQRNEMLATMRILSQADEAPTGPKAGTVENGYRFKGGDPADSKNWEKAK